MEKYKKHNLKESLLGKNEKWLLINSIIKTNILRKCVLSIWNNLDKYFNTKINNVNDKFKNKSNITFSNDKYDNAMEMNSKNEEILKFTNDYNNLDFEKRHRLNNY